MVGTFLLEERWGQRHERMGNTYDWPLKKILMIGLEDYRLNDEMDEFIWVLDKSRNYTTRSMYRRLSFWCLPNKRMMKLWRSRIPNKIKVFMWMAIQNRTQIGVNLKRSVYVDGKI